MSRLMQEPIWCEYVIQPGDTLTAIAKRQGCTVLQLAARNPQITDANLIYAGDRMQIPYGPAQSIDSAIGLVRNPYGHTEEQYIAAAQMLANHLIRNPKPEVSPALSRTDKAYVDAFYKLAKLMDIPAQPISPKEVFETQMLPKLQQALAVFEGQEPMSFLYENHRKETSVRKVLPIRTYYGTTEHYPEPGYLLEAFDKDRGAVRTFSVPRIKMHFT